MFILTTIQDLIQIAPQEFEKPSAQAIKDSVNTKYSNKVVQKVGLCICMWDLLEASEGLIGHGTGLVNVNVEFRMVVFRPFCGEILQGKIKHSDENGITIDLDFTSEVFIPAPSHLPENCRFDRAEDVWIWRSDDTDLFFDKGEPVRFRVEQEHFEDQKPTLIEKNEEGEEIREKSSAYRIVGSMSLPGLGPTLWWEEGGEEEGEKGD
ncbi:DNA-directed rna polymerase III 25 kd polypeptide [Zopfia rhizophila CBS 207.26]|uniref:DNA-directed RNA polymerase subunit n=1 Tax=Zopfia rhizophila CBS 207.26 TaxID=1314779 RepID=A0A6A6E6Y4_9PEZI|nr:DNA-directed rna polymerase III 25 kd polypeptide [Zopfia rhizophila CBS 207.26]